MFWWKHPLRCYLHLCLKFRKRVYCFTFFNIEFVCFVEMLDIVLFRFYHHSLMFYFLIYHYYYYYYYCCLNFTDIKSMGEKICNFGISFDFNFGIWKSIKILRFQIWNVQMKSNDTEYLNNLPKKLNRKLYMKRWIVGTWCCPWYVQCFPFSKNVGIFFFSIFM